RYGSVAFVHMCQAFLTMAQSGLPAHEWSMALPEFEVLGAKAHIGYDAEHSFYWASEDNVWPADIPHHVLLSDLDLLECATSLAQFQIDTPLKDQANPKAIDRWSKRNAAYLVPFKFVASTLADESLALRLMIPLIN